MTPQEKYTLALNYSQQICDTLVYKAQSREQTDNPEWLALCLFNLIEWNVPIFIHSFVAKRCLNNLSSFLPLESKEYVRKYFEIYS